MKLWPVWQSLQIRLTLLVILLATVSIGTAGLLFGRNMQEDLQRALGDDQVAKASHLAREIDRELGQRLRALEKLATDHTGDAEATLPKLREDLAKDPMLQSLFSAGIEVIDAAQLAVMDRNGLGVSLRRCRACVQKPIQRESGQTILPMMAPLRDAAGRVVGAVMGHIDLSHASVMQNFKHRPEGTQNESFLLIAPEHRMIVNASDPARIMEPLPPAGAMPSLDRFIDGYEGAAVVRGLDGEEVLAAAKRIPVANWYVAVLMPTAMAYAPIYSLQRQLAQTIAGLMLLLGCLVSWVVRRQLSPMRETVSELARFKESGRIPTTLPIRRHDELGTLVNAFNETLALLATRESELRKAWLVLEQSPESIIVTDHAGHIEYTNGTFSRTTGYPADEVLGRTLRFLHSGKTPPSTYQALWKTLNAGQVWRGEFINRRRDGSEFIEAATIAPVRQADGRVTHYVAIKLDVTEQRRLAAELDRHRRELEELVELRTGELNLALAAAQEASRVKGDFLASMSHEIRTPLNGVLGLAQIGYRNNVGRVETQATFSRILGSGKLLLTIINDILDFSKIEAGKLDVERVPVNPAQLADEAAAALLSAAEDKGLRIKVETSDLPQACLGDPVRIAQILLNLLSNAVKFTQSGEIQIRARRENQELVFQVIDTGIGISPEDQARLFRPFEQADASTTRRFGGTGLGLAISMRLAELMGGALSVTSVLEQGSTFTMRLPLEITDQPAVRNAPVTQAGKKRLSGLRILAAEDNGVNQLVLEDFLSQEGARVTMVDNGRSAIEAIEHAPVPFDIVLMDVQMPEMDGFEATRRIKARHPDLSIIGQTAHALKAEHDKHLAAGMVATIAKPIDIDLLVAVILRHTGSHDDALLTTSSVGDDDPDASEDSETAVLPVIDWTALEENHRNREGFIDRLVALALEHHGGAAQQLRSMATTADHEGIGKLAHNLKGFAGNLFAQEVAAVATRTVDAVRTNQPNIHDGAFKLANAMDRLMVALRARHERITCY
jgi:PAS domain S-box-containing protein